MVAVMVTAVLSRSAKAARSGSQRMAASAVRLLIDPALHVRVAIDSRRRVVERFCIGTVVPMYERCYERTVGG